MDTLAAQALLDADPPTRRLRMRIRLNVDDGDVRQALLVRCILRIQALGLAVADARQCVVPFTLFA